MNSFKKFYVLGMNAKLYMGVYFSAITLIVAFVSFLYGSTTISSLTLLEAIIVSLIIGFAQELMLGRKTDFTKQIFFGKSVLWLAISVVLTFGSSVLFNWFENLPFWCDILFGVFMLIGYSFMLLGLKFEQEMDTIKLNSDLQKFQSKQK